MNIKIIFPIHPRTEKKIDKLNLKEFGNLKIIRPCNYFKSLSFQKYSKLILTDSGGMQEEACILNRPCVTIRRNTERPETLIIKSNILVGYKSKNIKKGILNMISKKRIWKSPYGKSVSKKILDILAKNNEK